MGAIFDGRICNNMPQPHDIHPSNCPPPLSQQMPGDARRVCARIAPRPPLLALPFCFASQVCAAPGKGATHSRLRFTLHACLATRPPRARAPGRRSGRRLFQS